MIAIGLLLVRMLCDFFKPRTRLEAEIRNCWSMPRLIGDPPREQQEMEEHEHDNINDTATARFGAMPHRWRHRSVADLPRWAGSALFRGLPPIARQNRPRRPRALLRALHCDRPSGRRRLHSGEPHLAGEFGLGKQTRLFA